MAIIVNRETDTVIKKILPYALVVKAGTNVSKFGEVLRLGDFIEKNQFEEMDAVAVKDGDVLLSSTGTGMLGKCAVYRGDKPAIADGHVTILRLNQNELYPEYVCDYLRLGFSLGLSGLGQRGNQSPWRDRGSRIGTPGQG